MTLKNFSNWQSVPASQRLGFKQRFVVLVVGRTIFCFLFVYHVNAKTFTLLAMFQLHFIPRLTRPMILPFMVKEILIPGQKSGFSPFNAFNLLNRDTIYDLS